MRPRSLLANRHLYFAPPREVATQAVPTAVLMCMQCHSDLAFPIPEAQRGKPFDAKKLQAALEPVERELVAEFETEHKAHKREWHLAVEGR